MASMAAYNPATPEINGSDTGIEAKQASPRAIGINTDLPLDTKDDTGILTNNILVVASKKDTASSVTNTDGDHPDVDDEIRQRNAIPAINSGIDDANCVDSVASGEKKENTEGTPSVDEAGVNLTELGQEDTEAANNPSINTDAPPPTNGGISIAAHNEDHSSVSSDAESADTENTENEENNEERTPTLNKYGTNMTKLAQEGKLIPFDGREELVDRVIQILCRKTKCNPCLIGHPGVWKTAIIEGLAQRILSNNVPERLKGKKLLSITSEPESETYCSKELGEDIIEEIKKSNDTLVYFDEGHTIYSRVDLKKALAKGDIQCIGAADTVDEYTESSSLTRVFEKVEVPEPSMDDTLKVLKGLQKSYETHHKVHYTDEAFDAALKLANRYLSDGILIDTAIDLIDEAGSRVQLLEAKTAETYHKVDDTLILVTKEDVQHVVSFRTGIPVHEVSKEESERLLKLEETLHESIIGQHEALVAIANAIRRSRVGLKSPKRPIASFIFTGSTGVGKTEVAKALARQYFGSEDSMVRFDMSEYMEKHEVSKLIGSPPGYVRSEEGGLLTEAVRRKPHTVVLFDEIEKAHPNIMNIMLQILEDGRLTDNKGVTINFSNTIIIMTSNIGGNVIHCESTSGVPDHKIYKLVMKEIKKSFRAEFLNRFDEIIVFKQLTKEEVNQIADLMFKEVGDRLKAKDIKLNVSDRFRKKVVHDGYSPSHGARQLRRVITTLLENLLAAKLLSKEIKDGDSVVVDVDSEGNIEVIKEPSSLLGE